MPEGDVVKIVVVDESGATTTFVDCVIISEDGNRLIFTGKKMPGPESEKRWVIMLRRVVYYTVEPNPVDPI